MFVCVQVLCGFGTVGSFIFNLFIIQCCYFLCLEAKKEPKENSRRARSLSCLKRDRRHRTARFITLSKNVLFAGGQLLIPLARSCRYAPFRRVAEFACLRSFNPCQAEPVEASLLFGFDF